MPWLYGVAPPCQAICMISFSVSRQRSTHLLQLVYDLYSQLNGYRLLTKSTANLFGRETLPVYNLGQSDVILSFGADFLGTWLSSVRYGIEFGDFRSQPLGKRGYLAQLEPRMSITGAVADHWLPIKPETEGLVAQALARIIADQELGPAARVSRARALVAEVDVNAIASASDITVQELERLARAFAAADRPLAIPGSALFGQKTAIEAAAAVQMLNIIAGVSSEPGGMSLSPQPPLYTLLKPVPSSFSDVQAMIDRMKAGEIQVLLVHGANPLYDLPQNIGFLDALANVPYVVSFASIVDETAVQADLILPDRTYLESWGYDVVSPGVDVPIVSGQQPVVTPVFDARSTADVMLTVARGITAAAVEMPWADEVAFLKDIIGQLPAGAAGGSGQEYIVGTLSSKWGVVARRLTGSPSSSLAADRTGPGAIATVHQRGERISLLSAFVPPWSPERWPGSKPALAAGLT